MLRAYYEERGRGCHENGIPLDAARVLCDELRLDEEDRRDLMRHFRALDQVWLEWRDLQREAERKRAEAERKRAGRR